MILVRGTHFHVERRGCLKALRPWVGAAQVELQKLSKISAEPRNISRTRVLSFRLFVPSILVGRLAEGAAKLAAEMALIGKAGISGHFSERTL
jgi:hypothetical protein